MNSKKTKIILIVLVIVSLIVFITLFVLTMKLGKETDTSKGEEYISSMEAQNAQDIEQSLKQTEEQSETNNTTSSTENNTSEAETEPQMTEPATSETVETPTEPATQPSTEPVTQPPTEPVTQPPTEPGTEGFHSNNAVCYVPYFVDTNKAAAAVVQLDNGTLSVKELFSNSLFVGDSITSGFSDYKIVNSNNVIASVGARMAVHLPENLETIVQYNPDILILHYGLNEMGTEQHHLDTFINKYRECLTALKSRLPYTRIIVLGLTPVLDNAIQAQGRFVRIPAYNAAMRQMCVEVGVGYEENAPLFNAHQDMYGKDGIHIKSAMYKLWIRQIVEEMGLY